MGSEMCIRDRGNVAVVCVSATFEDFFEDLIFVDVSVVVGGSAGINTLTII